MRFKSPSLPELHAFLAVCQLGSFRQAAGVLCVTQVAVSRAVQRLEQRLNCTLFDRSHYGVQPTARGRKFQALVEDHVAGLESAIGRFGNGSQPEKLRISVVPTLGTQWLVPRLRDFRVLHPDVGIELRQFRHDEDFTRDDVDLWIDVNSPARPWPRGLRARLLLRGDVIPACTPELAARLRHPHDLFQVSLLHHVNWPGNWALWLRIAGGIDLEPSLGTGFDLSSNLIVAACTGMGVTVIQPWLIEAELASGQLVLPFTPAAATERGYYLCKRKALGQNDLVEPFSSWLMDESRKSVERFGLQLRGH